MNTHVKPLKQSERRARRAFAMLDIILYTTVVTIAMVVGLVAVRNALVAYFADAAVALDSLDQSYSITINGTTYTFADSPTLTCGVNPLIPAEQE